MKPSFQHIGILSHTDKPSVVETLQECVNYLKSSGKTITVTPEIAQALNEKSLKTEEPELLAKGCDLVISVGGDGSFLRAAHDVVESETPMLGINRGTLGFLTDINPQKLAEQLNDIFNGQFIQEKRFLLDLEIKHQGQTIASDCALNEIILYPNANPHMISFDIYIDQVFVCRERSDGLIITTPTGSTAYALSGGGSILHPEIDAIALVPMFSHTLSSRPLVVGKDHEIRIDISDNNRLMPRVSCDAQSLVDTPNGSQLLIKPKEKHLHLIHPLDYDYFGALRSKLHWGKKHYQDD